MDPAPGPGREGGAARGSLVRAQLHHFRSPPWACGVGAGVGAAANTRTHPPLGRQCMHAPARGPHAVSGTSDVGRVQRARWAARPVGPCAGRPVWSCAGRWCALEAALATRAAPNQRLRGWWAHRPSPAAGLHRGPRRRGRRPRTAVVVGGRRWAGLEISSSCLERLFFSVVSLV